MVINTGVGNLVAISNEDILFVEIKAKRRRLCVVFKDGRKAKFRIAKDYIRMVKEEIGLELK